MNDDENYFFNYEDYDPQEAAREYAEEKKRVKNLPVMKKAKEIFRTTQAVIETIDPKKDVLQLRNQMLLNAGMLGAKIAGAEGGDLFTLRMECAVLIKLAARDLLTETSACKMEGLSNSDYLNLLREEIEEFRSLFLDWIKTFDRTNDIQDEWGLFYA